MLSKRLISILEYNCWNVLCLNFAKLIYYRLADEFGGFKIAEIHWFPYILDESMNSNILAGPQSCYNSNDKIRFIATDNMISHGGLSDISTVDQKPVYKLFIGLYPFRCSLKLLKCQLRCFWNGCWWNYCAYDWSFNSFHQQSSKNWLFSDKIFIGSRWYKVQDSLKFGPFFDVIITWIIQYEGMCAVGKYSWKDQEVGDSDQEMGSFPT